MLSKLQTEKWQNVSSALPRLSVATHRISTRSKETTWNEKSQTLEFDLLFSAEWGNGRVIICSNTSDSTSEWISGSMQMSGFPKQWSAAGVCGWKRCKKSTGCVIPHCPTWLENHCVPPPRHGYTQTAAALVQYTLVIANDHWKLNVNSLFNPQKQFICAKVSAKSFTASVGDYFRLQRQALSLVPVQKKKKWNEKCKNLKRMVLELLLQFIVMIFSV